MKIRRLASSEREPLLDLLDGWVLSDGWRGRDFFRRPIESDPTYADENVWVAEESGRLVGCVQIFPRRLAVGDAEVPTGGIGSVYTHPDFREQGTASALLERSALDMRERGMELSLLFAGRLAFYARLGWRSWKVKRALLRRAGRGAAPEPGVEIAPFEARRDRDEVVGIHAAYSRRLRGTALRDAADWRASLELAGNPGEEFQVARAAGRVAAYARAIRLNEVLVMAELGRLAPPDSADALAALVERALQPREGDALAPQTRSSREFRSVAVLPTLVDEALVAALRRRLRVEPVDDPTVMLRCLDAPALARRLGLGAGDAPGLLSRALPPEGFAFWPADRF